MSQQSWIDLNSTNSPHLTIAAIHDTRDTETISLTTGHFHNIRGTSSYADRHAHLSRARLWLHVSPPTPGPPHNTHFIHEQSAGPPEPTDHRLVARPLSWSGQHVPHLINHISRRETLDTGVFRPTKINVTRAIWGRY